MNIEIVTKRESDKIFERFIIILVGMFRFQYENADNNQHIKSHDNVSWFIFLRVTTLL